MNGGGARGDGRGGSLSPRGRPRRRGVDRRPARRAAAMATATRTGSRWGTGRWVGPALASGECQVRPRPLLFSVFFLFNQQSEDLIYLGTQTPLEKYETCPKMSKAFLGTARNWFGDFWNSFEFTKNRIAFRNAEKVLL